MMMEGQKGENHGEDLIILDRSGSENPNDHQQYCSPMFNLKQGIEIDPWNLFPTGHGEKYIVRNTGNPRTGCYRPWHIISSKIDGQETRF